MNIFADFNTRLRPLRRIGRWIVAHLPELNFITLHYLYFIVTSLIAAIIFWGSSTPPRSVRFIDSLFLTVSAMTEAGLNTVNLSTLNTWQQVILFLLIMLGSAIWVSAFVVHVRRKAFERRFKEVIERERRIRGRSSWFPISKTFSRTSPSSHFTGSKSQSNPELADLERAPGTIIDQRLHDPVTKDGDNSSSSPQTIENEKVGDNHRAESDSNDVISPLDEVPTTAQHANGSPGAASDANLERKVSQTSATREAPRPDRITFASDTRFQRRAIDGDDDPDSGRFVHRMLSFQGVGARPGSTRRLSLAGSRRVSADVSRVVSEDQNEERRSYMPSSGFLARNSTFHNLTEEDRLRLGGTEYKAIVFLSWVVPIYFVLWQLLGCLACGAYVNNYYASTTEINGINPYWTGAFNAVSAFNNSGMSLLDANMTAFQRAIYLLITMGLLILAGNTMYPVFLRWIVLAIRYVLPRNEDWSDLRNTLQFLLDHPRRCYTNLFAAQHTWWLLLSVFVLNGIDTVMFVILNIGNPAITSDPPGIEFIDGLFQALAVRAGGFYVVNISSVRVSLQVLYVTMMYISAFPVAITIRNSNVYEERSLGIYSDDPGYDDEKFGTMGFVKKFLHLQLGTPSQTKGYFVQQQLRAQLAHDIWWLVIAVWLIMIIENTQFEENPAVFSVFNVIFEVVSAYGTVGISLGVPWAAYSFSGAWHSLSKLVLCAVMLRGRHRGLPVAIDKAVLLPRDYLDDFEDQDAEFRTERAGSVGGHTI